ncbi:UNVERIFIED_CONTAM: hypothetical protein PYX00_008592 [Menopon gallinae]|uniref:Uncharacterized protein n=1 Tax=Menopon gallinae TaxID=328185 RepID=A0AAW2HP06_9NEOP
MANISKQHISENQEKIQKLFEKFVFLNKKMIDNKFSLVELEKVTFVRERNLKSDKSAILPSPTQFLTMVLIILLTLSFGFLSNFPILDILVDSTLGIRCVIPNNYFIWEATRPVTDCKMCENVTEVLNLWNCTREEFAEFAYTSRPLVIRNSASHWPAMNTFNFEFFKDLFETIEGSYESVEEECQFLTFKSDFLSLRDVFHMKKSRRESWPRARSPGTSAGAFATRRSCRR